MIAQHSLPGGRYPLPEPDFHRLDRASFAWRTQTDTYRLILRISLVRADAVIIVPPRVDAVLSATADTEPTQRDCHIQAIAGKGRMAWQRDSGYNERARVEGQFALEAGHR
jgi:hypothetical protein